LNTQEKRIPPKAEKKYSVTNFQNPSPFSRPDPITIVDNKFKQRCIKLACRKTGVINLHT